MKCVIYTRVSGADQAKHGVSLLAQEAKCRAYAAMNEMQVFDHFHDDGVSAKNATGRPQFLLALKTLANKEAGALVFVKLDRAVRSVADANELVQTAEKEGWSLHSIDERLDTGSAIGRFCINVIASLGQMERELVGERTQAALSHLKATGKRYCRNAPWGFRYEDGKMVEDQTEQHIANIIANDTWKGFAPSKIAGYISAAGFPPRKGRQWTAALVRSIQRSAKRQAAQTPHR